MLLQLIEFDQNLQGARFYFIFFINVICHLSCEAGVFNPISHLNAITVSWKWGRRKKKRLHSRGEMVPHRTIHHALNYREMGSIFAHGSAYVCVFFVVYVSVRCRGTLQCTEGIGVVQDAVRTVMRILQYEQQFDS